jgi:trehalose-6-phosphate synthase
MLMNPWNINKVADQIHLALTMSSKEKAVRHEQNWLIAYKVGDEHIVK